MICKKWPSFPFRGSEGITILYLTPRIFAQYFFFSLPGHYNIFMIKFLLGLILVTAACSSLVQPKCIPELTKTAEALKKVLDMELSNQKIDAFT